jgi:hypothetical protein
VLTLTCSIAAHGTRSASNSRPVWISVEWVPRLDSRGQGVREPYGLKPRSLT